MKKLVILLILLAGNCNKKKMFDSKYELSFDTAYHQFYIAENITSIKTNSVDFWSDEANNNKLAFEKGVLGVHTASYGEIDLRINVLDKPIPENQFSEDFDHIVEGSIEVKSGKLFVLDCPNTEIQSELNVDRGIYRIRVCMSNLEGDDKYTLFVWKEDEIKNVKVLKQY